MKKKNHDIRHRATNFLANLPANHSIKPVTARWLLAKSQMLQVLLVSCMAIVLLAQAVIGRELEYSPQSNDYLLMHLNGDSSFHGQGKGAAAKLFGDARFVDGGWIKGALTPGSDGGIIVKTDRPFNKKYNHITVEARVFLTNYPDERAMIAEKVYEAATDTFPNRHPPKAAFGFSVFIDSKGRLCNEIKTIAYGARNKKVFCSEDNFTFPLRQWVHVAVVNAGFPVGKYVMYANRKAVFNKAHEFIHRTEVSPATAENTPGKIVVGNDIEHQSAFPGLIDEVRILQGVLSLHPLADTSWTLPQQSKTIPTAVLLKDTKPKIHISCDELDSSFTQQGYNVTYRNGEKISGVYGNAYSGGEIRIDGDGILRGDEASIEFWMMPRNWNNQMVQNLRFLSGGDSPYFNMYVHNSLSKMSPISFYFHNDKKQTAFVSMSRLLDEQNWHHIVLTWKKGLFQIFHNGQNVAREKLPDSDNWQKGIQKILTFIGKQDQNLTAFDEIYVYDHQLTRDEVWNGYYRYRDPTKLRKVSGYDVEIHTYPGLRKTHVAVDFSKGVKPSLVSFGLFQDDRRVLSVEENIASSQPSVEAMLPQEKLSPGKYQLQVTLKDKGGAVLDTINNVLEKKEYPWLGKGLGVPNSVPPPWKPLSQNGNNVDCLLTQYTFDEHLIDQVVTNQENQLAGPVVLQLREGDSFHDLPPTKSTVSVPPDGLSATISQKGTYHDLTIDSQGAMEFDGFIKYRLKLAAKSNTATIAGLRLRIPMRVDQAKDYYVIGEDMDYHVGQVPSTSRSFWDSINAGMTHRRDIPEYGAMKKAKSSLRYGNFKPYAWMGNNHRGLCFMADNDKGWVQSNEVSAIDFRREKDAVSLYLNFIGESVVIKRGQPREITFSLMATPSKEPAKGWRQWRTRSFFVNSAAGRVKGDSMFYVPYPADYETSTEYLSALRKKGETLLPYSDFYGSDNRMATAHDFRWEWWPEDQADEPSYTPVIYPTYYGSGSIIDWYLCNIDKWVDSAAVNGLYVDNHYARAMFDDIVGPAYQHEKGEVQAGYQLFALREWLKRIYCLMSAKGKEHPYTMVHMTHTMIAPTMSFADIAYEGEDHYIDGKKSKQQGSFVPDHIDYWPNEHVRIIDLPHSWGVGTHWLQAVVGGEDDTWQLERSRDDYIAAWYTQLMLHDQKGEVHDDKGRMASFNRFFDTDEDYEFTLYRDNRAVFSTDKEIFVSYYKRSGQVLAVVGNHAHTDRQCSLHIVPPLLGMAEVTAARDYETTSLININKNTLSITVPSRSYRLILLGSGTDL